MSLMLEGLRVVDFSRLLPGPFASLLLADMGAEVIKVEDDAGGDYARYYPPMVGESSAFFESVNRNKKSVTVNLKDPAGRAAIHKLLATADVVLESFRPGVMDQLGVGYEHVRALKSDIVYCSISGYGQTGPFRTRAGHDMNYMAHAGMLIQTGTTPAVPGFQLADIAGGALYAALGITSALFRRERTGQGAVLDISMTEGALSFGLPMFAIHAAGGATDAGGAMLSGGIAAYNLYETADGRWLSVGSLEPKFWMGFLEAIDAAHLVGEGHTPQSSARQAVADILRTRTLEAWVEVFRGRDVCVEPVLNLDEVLQSSLHEARKVFFTLSGVQQARTPVTPERDHSPAPALGQHNAEIFGELGLDPLTLLAKESL